MELTHRDVLQILELLEQSDVEYLEIELGDTRLVASRYGELPVIEHGERVPARSRGPAAGAPPGADSMSAVAETDAEAPEGASRRLESSDREPAAVEHAAADEVVDVTAPMVGVFYRAPEPGAPPFVEVGSNVDEATTMGLIEVMKVFNSVSAGVSGEVAAILVENEEFVEYRQTLFRVRRERSA